MVKRVISAILACALGGNSLAYAGQAKSQLKSVIPSGGAVYDGSASNESYGSDGSAVTLAYGPNSYYTGTLNEAGLNGEKVQANFTAFAPAPPNPGNIGTNQDDDEEGSGSGSSSTKKKPAPKDPAAVAGAAMMGLAGALLGFAMGGPIGACIGFVLGAFMGALTAQAYGAATSGLGQTRVQQTPPQTRPQQQGYGR